MSATGKVKKSGPPIGKGPRNKKTKAYPKTKKKYPGVCDEATAGVCDEATADTDTDMVAPSTGATVVKTQGPASTASTAALLSALIDLDPDGEAVKALRRWSTWP